MDTEYILKENQLQGLVDYFFPGDKDDPEHPKLKKMKTGFDKIQQTKETISSSLVNCQWIHYEQTHFIYAHRTEGYRFNDRGICASMALLLFNECTGKSYPITAKDLSDIMDNNIAILEEYGKKYDADIDVLKKDPLVDRNNPKWDLPAFKSFCTAKGVNIEEKHDEDILVGSDNRWDLDNINLNDIYFIGEKAEKGDVTSAHVVLLRRTEEGWYLFDPTLGIFITPNKDTVKNILVIKTNARIDKVGTGLKGYTVYYLASKP